MSGSLPGRILFGVAIVGFGVLCLMYVDFVDQLQPVPSWVPGQAFLAVLTGIVLIASEITLLTVAELVTLPKGQAFAVLSGGQLGRSASLRSSRLPRIACRRRSGAVSIWPHP